MPTNQSSFTMDAPPGPIQRMPPRILVADDDPVSLLFLADALRQLGADVQVGSDGPSTIAQARTNVFDMLLLDCRMPGGGAREVWVALREDTAAATRDAIAIASSAEMTYAERESLLAAGFLDTLSKPCSFADLRRLLSLLEQPATKAALLDDTVALAASGGATIVYALRGLLQRELLTLDRELDALALDSRGLGERLHRLRASCGFCGATALAAQALSLQQSLTLDQIDPLDVFRMNDFRKVLHETIDALESADRTGPTD